MKKIEELGEIEYKVPRMCNKMSEEGKPSAPDVIDILVVKVDEIVKRVNVLMEKLEK